MPNAICRDHTRDNTTQVMIELNGYVFRATEVEAARAVIALAAGELDEPAYVTFLRANSTARSTG